MDGYPPPVHAGMVLAELPRANGPTGVRSLSRRSFLFETLPEGNALWATVSAIAVECILLQGYLSRMDDCGNH